TLISDGRPVAQGAVEQLNVAPQQHITMDLGYTLPKSGSELLLNVRYLLKQAEGLLAAGTILASEQLEVRPYTAYTADLIPSGLPVWIEPSTKAVVVKGETFTLCFDRVIGWLTDYVMDGKPMLKTDYPLRPCFWRAPTDNDFGAKMQEKFELWRAPQMKLTALESVQHDTLAYVTVTAQYEMPELAAHLTLTYQIDGSGTMAVQQSLTGDSTQKQMPHLFRFGMEWTMPQTFDRLIYYGRGPIENYADRKAAAEIGIYFQQVEDQYYPYVRPQESGNKCDVRMWQQVDLSGRGIEIRSDLPFSASALPYRTSDLDDGLQKHQRHSGELTPRSLVNLHLDLAQMGVGGEDGWGSWPRPAYLLPYGDYTFRFVVRPLGGYKKLWLR
ncbi:MAG: DUF4981 domain-containing protein, partial [Alistipes sp.]|nr:DUF4981 domain-containing protein [Alistipes sp.]